ncbi:MAG TPA: hypothetical protein VKM69_01645 [Natronoarchaeum rubrum]|jgi:hypothetical protein|nr:hypothetical protein [Natronoarchaeum rubrum]
MDETKRHRLAAIWIAFALLVAYVRLADGFTLGVGDVLGLLVSLLGLGLGVAYYRGDVGLDAT